MEGKRETPVLFGDVCKNDIAELVELVQYFNRAGKHENAAFLYGLSQRYEIICSAYSTAISREQGKEARRFDALRNCAPELLSVLKEIAGGTSQLVRTDLHEKARATIAKAEAGLRQCENEA